MILNSYGAGHGIDHDDGSNFWSDTDNVVGFSHACKGNYGSNRNCSGNLIVGPGLQSMFSHGTETGPCAYESNNGHGSTFANKYFEGNTCIQPVAPGSTVPAYMFQSCNPAAAGGAPELGGTVWATRGNRFWVSANTSVAVPCGHKNIPLEEWLSRYGQDPGALVEPIPPTVDVLAAARALLGVPPPA